MSHKPRHPQNQRSEIVLVKELSGFVDLASNREALRVIRLILSQVTISPDAFFEVINAIGVIANMNRWVVPIEAAWNRQSSRFQRETNSAMLMLYGGLGDWQKAAVHAAPRLLHSPSDFLFGLEALMSTGRIMDAKRAARKARAALERTRDRFERSCLIEALASFHAANRDWKIAFDLWANAPRDQPLGHNAAIGHLEICIAQTLEFVRDELAALQKLPLKFDQELMLRGNEEGLRKDIKKDLLRLRRGLENLLPAHRRKALGMVDRKAAGHQE